MTTNDLIKSIFLRISRFKFFILICGLLFAVLLFLYARNIKPVYSTRASVFPLTASSDNSASTSALSSLLGISESPKSFSQEASINIVELALSRNVREAVAMERIPEMGNKTIAELLIENYNRTKSFFASSIKKPTDAMSLAALGGDLLKGGMQAKINKNGILEMVYSNTGKDLIGPVCYKFIDKISEFYKDLKIKKAKLDYDFTIRKIDSLDVVLNSFDKKAIRLSNTTLFVPSERIEFSIPKENLSNQKEWVTRQRDASANNREEALWRLQKVTPIIATLDKPDPPYDAKKPSSILYSGIGFFLGCILSILLLITGLLYKYAKFEVNKAIFGGNESQQTTVV
ncbi:MAG: Wzz/FepE/Etk N-terminal domain-containing protein [Ferruginibacter sp.]